MSQPPMPPYGSPPPGYAPQYAFWPYYASTPDALLAPARRAGWTLVGMGVAALLLGTCVGALFAAMAPAQLGELLNEVQKQQANSPRASAAMSVTTQQLRLAMIAIGVVVGGVGLVAVALGALVRTGRRGWIVTAMIACSLLLLYFAFALITGLLGGPTSFVQSVLVLAVPVAATAFAMTCLAQALRNASQIEAARQHAAYAAYYSAPPPPQGG